MRFSGAVLTGGSSSRMGRDKAFVEVHGEPLVQIPRRALIEAGADRVHAVGGDVQRLASLGFMTDADRHPGEGPLGGIIDALRASADAVMVVLACDQPRVDAALIRRLVDAFDEVHDAVVPVVNGIVQPLAAAYSIRARPALEDAFAAGERSPSRALGSLTWRSLDDVAPELLVDVDDPDDLARYARRNERQDSDVK